MYSTSQQKLEFALSATLRDFWSEQSLYFVAAQEASRNIQEQPNYFLIRHCQLTLITLKTPL